MVERPYLHMIGRSSASSEDMQHYTAERIDEIVSTMNGVVFEGRTYWAAPRLFSGKYNTKL